MTPEFKEKWLGGLRSGKYQQGRGALRHRGNAADFSDDKFCCLGVLLDAVIPERWLNPDQHAPGEVVTANYNSYNEYEDEYDEGEHEQAEGELEGDLANLCEIGEHQSKLVQMNDGVKWASSHNGSEKGETVDGTLYVKGKEPKDFNTIANYIEEHL